MCAECRDTGPIACVDDNRGIFCGLRFIYCLQPYGSESFDPPLVLQPRLGGSDNVTRFLHSKQCYEWCYLN